MSARHVFPTKETPSVFLLIPTIYDTPNPKYKQRYVTDLTLAKLHCLKKKKESVFINMYKLQRPFFFFKNGYKELLPPGCSDSCPIHGFKFLLVV